MAVLKEFKCLMHGSFEGYEPVCSHGCTTVVREFLTAPGYKSAKTKISDTALNRMAARYGLTDMSASKTGSVAGDRIAKQKGFGQIGGHDFTPKWGEIPKGGTYDVASKSVVARDGAKGGAESIMQSMSGGQAEAQAGALPVDIPRMRATPNVVGRDSVTANEFSDALAKAS